MKYTFVPLVILKIVLVRGEGLLKYIKGNTFARELEFTETQCEIKIFSQQKNGNDDKHRNIYSKIMLHNYLIHSSDHCVIR